MLKSIFLGKIPKKTGKNTKNPKKIYNKFVRSDFFQYLCSRKRKFAAVKHTLQTQTVCKDSKNF